MYVTPHTEAVKQVDEELRKNPAFLIPEEVRAKCQPQKDLGAENSKYVKAWELIRQK